jgi:hypothetical protein
LRSSARCWQRTDLRGVARAAHLELRRPSPFLGEPTPGGHDGTPTEACGAGVQSLHQRCAALAVELTDQGSWRVREAYWVGRERIDHLPGARDGERTRINDSSGERRFRLKDEA